MSFQRQANVVQQIMAFPCANPSPIIWAAVFLPAITPSLLEYISFGCRDILKLRLGREAPCGRMLKAQVQKAIPPAWQSTTKTLLKWEARFSLAGQIWMIADLASKADVRWTSLAYRMAGCPYLNQGASWNYEFSVPKALEAFKPTPIGGFVTDYMGDPGLSWPTGAIVPKDWYCSIHFSVTAQTLIGGRPVGLSTWIRAEGPDAYDYDANTFPKPYPGFSSRAEYALTLRNQFRNSPRQYTMMAMSDELALTTSMSGSAAVSPVDPVNDAISPLSCFRQLVSSRTPDPAGANRKPKNQPFIFDPFLPEPRTRPRGPPEGLPRPKGKKE